jgi:hypothetical protein
MTKNDIDMQILEELAVAINSSLLNLSVQFTLHYKDTMQVIDADFLEFLLLRETQEIDIVVVEPPVVGFSANLNIGSLKAEMEKLGVFRIVQGSLPKLSPEVASQVGDLTRYIEKLNALTNDVHQSETKCREFISPILVEAITIANNTLGSNIELSVEEQLTGSQNSGPLDYRATSHGKTICIIEAKKFEEDVWNRSTTTPTPGLVQNLRQLVADRQVLLDSVTDSQSGVCLAQQRIAIAAAQATIN